MYFSPLHLTCASALPGETGNPKSASFHLSAACFLPKAQETHQSIAWLQPNHFSLSKRSTGCTRQDLESCCMLPACSMLTNSVTVSVAVQNMRVVLRQASVKDNGQY